MKFFRFLLATSPRARFVLLAAVVVGVVSGGSSVGLLALINDSLAGEATLPFAWAAALFALLCLVVTVSRVASQYLLARLGQDMILELRLKLARQILRAPLTQLEKLGPNRLLATLTDDVNSVIRSLLFVPVLCINGTIVLGCLGYLAYLNGPLFLMLLVVVGLGILSYQGPAQAGIRRFRQAREEQDALFAHFRDLTDGVKELKLHRHRRGAFLDLLETTADRMRRLRIVATLIFGTASAWGHLLFFVVIGVLLYVRPAFISAEPATLISYTVVLLYMMSPLQSILDGFPTLGRSSVAVDKVERLGFTLAPEAPAGDRSGEPVAAWERLELRGVTHTYHREGQEHPFTLGPIDEHLDPGEIVFLVGGNGSGKTTLAKILVGLYPPEEGSLVLDGEPVESEDLDRYRQHFSVVFGDFHLFDSLLGMEATPDLDERARRYLGELEIDHKVEVEGGALSTLDLSQGQRKRLALLTAYLEDRPIYVFDEWAADQDPVFKEVFYREILPELKRRGKSVVAISHDDRYFHLGDRVLKLEEGRISRSGAWSAAEGVPVSTAVSS